MKPLILPLALLAVLVAYQATAQDSSQQEASPGGSGLICMSIDGVRDKSCDQLCATQAMACTGFTSPISPSSCDTATSEIGVCRCCKVK